MTHMVKIAILTGYDHEQKGNLHFYPKAYFSLHIY